MWIETEDTKACIEVPEQLWSLAEGLHASFSPTLSDISELELSLLFIEHAMNGKPSEQLNSLIGSLLSQFAGKHLDDGASDAHAVFPGKTDTLGLNPALAILFKAASKTGLLTTPQLSLLKEADVRMVAVFSGQASSEDLLGELKQLLNTYGPLLNDLFAHLAQILKEASEDREAQEFFLDGFDLASWMHGPVEAWPPASYILAAPRSFPLVGLIQLLNYQLLLKLYGVQPYELAKCFVAGTGHSQGIIPAAMLAMARTHEDVFTGAGDVLKILFWTGLRCQQAQPLVTLHPDIVAEAVERGEGAPSPMLSVSGLSRALLQTHIDTQNANSEGEDYPIAIGLKNGPTSFIICGSPAKLYNLLLALRPLQASPQEDQSRVPHSQRKLTFRLRFLPVSVPFHSEGLKPAVPKIMADLERTGCTFFTRPGPSLYSIPHLQSGMPNDVMHALNITICNRRKLWNGGEA